MGGGGVRGGMHPFGYRNPCDCVHYFTCIFRSIWIKKDTFAMLFVLKVVPGVESPVFKPVGPLKHIWYR